MVPPFARAEIEYLQGHWHKGFSIPISLPDAMPLCGITPKRLLVLTEYRASQAVVSCARKTIAYLIHRVNQICKDSALFE